MVLPLPEAPAAYLAVTTAFRTVEPENPDKAITAVLMLEAVVSLEPEAVQLTPSVST